MNPLPPAGACEKPLPRREEVLPFTPCTPLLVTQGRSRLWFFTRVFPSLHHHRRLRFSVTAQCKHVLHKCLNGRVGAPPPVTCPCTTSWDSPGGPPSMLEGLVGHSAGGSLHAQSTRPPPELPHVPSGPRLFRLDARSVSSPPGAGGQSPVLTRAERASSRCCGCHHSGNGSTRDNRVSWGPSGSAPLCVIRASAFESERLCQYCWELSGTGSGDLGGPGEGTEIDQPRRKGSFLKVRLVTAVCSRK